MTFVAGSICNSFSCCITAIISFSFIPLKYNNFDYLPFFTEVEEVVHAIVYLLSDKASMINGTILPVDGGFLAQ